MKRWGEFFSDNHKAEFEKKLSFEKYFEKKLEDIQRTYDKKFQETLESNLLQNIETKLSKKLNNFKDSFENKLGNFEDSILEKMKIILTYFEKEIKRLNEFHNFLHREDSSSLESHIPKNNSSQEGASIMTLLNALRNAV